LIFLWILLLEIQTNCKKLGLEKKKTVQIAKFKIYIL
jgi:hypothetical protein